MGFLRKERSLIGGQNEESSHSVASPLGNPESLNLRLEGKFCPSFLVQENDLLNNNISLHYSLCSGPRGRGLLPPKEAGMSPCFTCLLLALPRPLGCQQEAQKRQFYFKENISNVLAVYTRVMEQNRCSRLLN